VIDRAATGVTPRIRAERREPVESRDRDTGRLA
jgi:hypothetical protein